MASTTSKTILVCGAVAAVLAVGAGLALVNNASYDPAGAVGTETISPGAAGAGSEVHGYQGYDVFGRPLGGVGGRVMPVTVDDPS